jgi:hypothetical protein
MREPAEERPVPEPLTIPALAVIAIAAIATVWLGVYPSQILNLADYSTLALK